MKTVATKLYDRLTAKERLAAIMAAAIRGDDADRLRLESSAPMRTVAFPSHYLRGRAMASIIAFVSVRLLASALAGDKNAVAAWLASWASFCHEHGLDAVATLADVPEIGRVVEMADGVDAPIIVAGAAWRDLRRTWDELAAGVKDFEA